MKSLLTTLCLSLFVAAKALAMNPYLPLWEHIPDGEPYVFDDPDRPGYKRVYIYGSHDMLKTQYCGTNLVVWSASVDSLDNWRYGGVILSVTQDAQGQPLHKDGRGDVLYAPDVAVVTLPNGKKVYYLYPNNQESGRNGMVAVSDRPDGPFKVINWSKSNPRNNDGILGFDPAVFVDDDGRVYGYWGFGTSCAAELDPKTMATVKPGTRIVENLVSGFKQEGIFRFYEASSMRKIKDKYVLIYSRWTADGEFGLPASNYTLAYAYSDNPLGPFTYGGTIIDCRGRDTDANNSPMVTATPNGNTHGSIAEINGKWYVFFHRQTGTSEYARQAMVAPIEVNVEKGPGGKVSISEAEYTSEGFETEGLDPLKTYPAAIASHFTGPTPAYQKYPTMHYTGPYFSPVYMVDHTIEHPYANDINFNPVVNNVDGSILGYKYFNFTTLHGCKNIRLSLDLIPGKVDGVIKVYTQAPWKGKPKPIGTLSVAADKSKHMVTREIKLKGMKKMTGKHPLYLTFSSAEKGKSVCTLIRLRFVK